MAFNWSLLTGKHGILPIPHWFHRFPSSFFHDSQSYFERQGQDAALFIAGMAFARGSRRSHSPGSPIYDAVGQLSGRKQSLVVRPSPRNGNHLRLCASRRVPVLHRADISGWHRTSYSCPPRASVRPPISSSNSSAALVNFPGYFYLDLRRILAWLWRRLWNLSRA